MQHTSLQNRAILTHHRQFFWSKFSKLSVQYWTNRLSLVCSSHANTIWHSVSCNHTVFIVRKHHHLLHFRLWVTKFFWSRRSLQLPNITLRFYFRIEIPHPCLINGNYLIQKFFSSLLDHFKCSCAILRHVCFCISVNACGTYYNVTFFLNKCSVSSLYSNFCFYLPYPLPTNLLVLWQW